MNTIKFLNKSSYQKQYPWTGFQNGKFFKSRILQKCLILETLYNKNCPDLKFTYDSNDNGISIIQKHLISNDVLDVKSGMEVFCQTNCTTCNHRTISNESILTLAKIIDEMHLYNYFHGNINAKNIVFIKTTGQREYQPVLLNMDDNLPYINYENQSVASRFKDDWMDFHKMITRKPTAFYESEGWMEIVEWLYAIPSRDKTQTLAKNFILKALVCDQVTI